MTEYLTPRDIDDFVQQIKTNYLECRVHGHARIASSASAIDMSSYDGIDTSGGVTYIQKTLRCRNRCGVAWSEVINGSTGEVVIKPGPDYSQAPLYLAKGIGRLTKGDRNRLRLEQLQRWMEAHA